jgi:dihydroorotate dehydrogenase electron transfer subunit
MPKDIATQVIRNDDLGHGYHLIEFATPGLTEMQPARFFMIGIPGSETLLRRPFSICGANGTFADGAPDAAQVLYKVVGKGTALLALLKPGAPLNVLGPLGNGFTSPPEPAARPVILAGGIGAAPFPALVAALQSEHPRAMMFYGGRTRHDLPLLGWFEERADLVVTTDDGSRGRKGLVTEPLVEMLADADPAALKLYACGPEPMLKAVARLARERGLDCELSLEAHMACGFGVCLGCVVPTRRGSSPDITYDRVCVEGPVMRPEVLAW